MTKIEKVIKGLEICAGGTNSCTSCPFNDNCKGTSNAAMAAAIKLLKAQEAQGWISVKDRLPEKSGEYLVFIKVGYHAILQYSTRHKAFNALDDEDLPLYRLEVTHWMSLFDPPKEEKDDDENVL